MLLLTKHKAGLIPNLTMAALTHFAGEKVELRKQVSFALGHTAGSASSDPGTSDFRAPSDFIPSRCVSLPPLPPISWPLSPPGPWPLASVCQVRTHRSPACLSQPGGQGSGFLIRGLRFEGAASGQAAGDTEWKLSTRPFNLGPHCGVPVGGVPGRGWGE